MRKNVAGQNIQAQLTDITTGAPVTAGGAVTFSGDGAAQAAGAGVLTHLGGGEWNYAPLQAETNFDHIAFQFTGTNAIAVLPQVYTTFPQTGDSFARIGLLGVGLTELGGMSAAMRTEVNLEMVDVFKVDTSTLPGQGAPTETPTLEEILTFLYKAWSHKLEQTATEYRLFDAAGTQVDQKAPVSDAAGVTTKDQVVSGP